MSLVVSALSTVAVLGRLAPSFAGQTPTLTVIAPSYAQAFSDQEITKYAKAVLEIEPVRKGALDRFKKFVESTNSVQLSEIACHKVAGEGLPWLTKEPRQIVVDYCEQSKEIVENNGMSIRRFNEITVNSRSNSELMRRIRNELLRLKKGSG